MRRVFEIQQATAGELPLDYCVSGGANNWSAQPHRSIWIGICFIGCHLLWKQAVRRNGAVGG